MKMRKNYMSLAIMKMKISQKKKTRGEVRTNKYASNNIDGKGAIFIILLLLVNKEQKQK
jgi:hypothetical protein